LIKPNNGGQVIDLAGRFKAIVVQILRLAPAVRPVRQPEPTPSGSRGGAKFKNFEPSPKGARAARVGNFALSTNHFARAPPSAGLRGLGRTWRGPPLPACLDHRIIAAARGLLVGPCLAPIVRRLASLAFRLCMALLRSVQIER
jgi:hypothetical protein